VAAIVAVSVSACSPFAEESTVADWEGEPESSVTPSWREVDPPIGSYSMAPNLVVAGDRLHASWIERFESSAGETRHRLMMATLSDEGWSAPATIAEGGDFFANWADLPAIAVSEDGTLYAHWLAKTDAETYAYSIFLASSIDGGKTWSPLGRLNDDDTPTEHGFVTYTPEGEGVRAFWLDGREMVEEKPMTLRTAWVGETVGASEVLEKRVCECCSTDAALSGRGPVLVFRDRSNEEIRDIGVIRREGDGWTATNRVHADDWMIPGCPVNGPAIAAADDTLAVAWYTASGDQPKVQLAFSADAGESFETARVVDEGRALGRVDVVLDESGAAVVSWLEGVGAEAEIRLRRVWPDGRIEESVPVARTTAARAGGFPRLVRIADHLYLAWVETDGEEASRIRMREVPVTAL
jgi:hypothetical protein